MRLFYALKIDLETVPEIKTSLIKLKKDANAKEWEVRFTPPENLHITLNFLGEVAEDEIPRLCSIGKNIAALHPAFPLKISGFDAFPELQHARVIWAGVQNKKILQALYESLETELQFLKRIPENSYVPHLTLARLRNPHSVKNFLSPFLRKQFGSINCTEIGLYKSELRGLYPHYELIQSFSLQPQAEEANSNQVF